MLTDRELELCGEGGVHLAVQHSETPLISVVIPCYNEQENIDSLFLRLNEVRVRVALPFEFIFVNDGSTDATLKKLENLAAIHTFVKVVDLSRNFGHQLAITAGIEHAQGEAVVIIDADLQDPPELIAELLKKWREGYDVVYAVRKSRRGETLFKKMTAKMFYRLLDRITDIPIPLDTGDFRLMDRRVVDELVRIRDRHRFVRGLVSWVGFRQIGLPYVRDERLAGQTKYPFKKMLKFSLDGITSFSYKPLQWATKLGFVASLSGFFLIVVLVYMRLFTPLTIQGWTSLMVAVLFIGGIQLLMLGVLGEYIGRIYDEVRERPLYIVRKRYNFDVAKGDVNQHVR